MFKTLKSKLLIIALSTLVVLSIMMSVFSSVVYEYAKEGIFRSYNYGISIFAQEVNQEVAEIENNAHDLALLGEVYYSYGKNNKSMEFGIPEIFKNYPISLGGGIWFEPYVNNPKKRWSCLYVYRNDDGKLVIDENFESPEYNYHNQSWYKEIKSQLKKGDTVHWSLPYHEAIGSNTLMVTAGSGIYDKNKKLVGISTVDWEISSIMKTISHMKPTSGSFALFADLDNDYVFVSTDKYVDNTKITGNTLKSVPWYSENLKDNGTFTYRGKKYVSFIRKLENNMVLIVNVPEYEMFYMTFIHLLILLLLLMGTTLIISFILYFVLHKNIANPIDKLIHIANKLSNGELNTEIKIEKPEEFAKLADAYNKMVKDIGNITKEREKTETELLIAKKIQLSSLPSTFPAYPDRKEFDIYATMEPAKEVGGDFYDFYFIDKDNILFLVADVSGKGVPAALFMMTVKTIINNVAQAGYKPQEMFDIINKKICANNQVLFVTLFASIANIKTGKITYINCGHNPPLIRKNNKFEYLKTESNTVLGAFDDTEFKAHDAYLNKNDILFLYTDGVTEAQNKDLEMYGENRLEQTLNKTTTENLQEIISVVKSDIKNFTGDIPQSDDTTMLAFRFNQNPKFLYKDTASTENYSEFHKWVKNICNIFNISNNIKNKIEIITEEIYLNVAFYAYKKNTGTIEVEFIKVNDTLTIIFTDSGIEYNPLIKEEPDIDIPLEERDAGGMGIFMVKNYADNCEYEYKNGKNILKIMLYI